MRPRCAHEGASVWPEKRAGVLLWTNSDWRIGSDATHGVGTQAGVSCIPRGREAGPRAGDEDAAGRRAQASVRGKRALGNTTKYHKTERRCSRPFPPEISHVVGCPCRADRGASRRQVKPFSPAALRELLTHVDATGTEAQERGYVSLKSPRSSSPASPASIPTSCEKRFSKPPIPGAQRRRSNGRQNEQKKMR